MISVSGDPIMPIWCNYLDTGVFCATREDLRGFLTILLHLHQRWKPRRSKIRQTPVTTNALWRLDQFYSPNCCIHQIKLVQSGLVVTIWVYNILPGVSVNNLQGYG
jgi:hypothetical protein